MPNTKPDHCGVCAGVTELVWREDHREYSLWECGYCQAQFWSPMKNPGAEWYEKDERYSFRNLNPLRKPERNHREFLKDSQSLISKSPRLLDVGMGTGNFLAVAVDRGYDGYGLDFDRDAIEAAQTFFGLKNVYALNLDEAFQKFGAGFFDVITFFEVVEHLENPGEFLEKAKKLLKPDGYMAISVPHRRNFEFMKVHDKPPRHLTRWNETAMRNFLAQHGFSVVRFKAIPATIPFLITKFHFWFKGIFSFGLVQKISKSGSHSEQSEESREILQSRVSFRMTNKKIKLLQLLARAKDYILFFIPAFFLWLFLLLSGRRLGLYVLAKKS